MNRFALEWALIVCRNFATDDSARAYRARCDHWDESEWDEAIEAVLTERREVVEHGVSYKLKRIWAAINGPAGDA